MSPKAMFTPPSVKAEVEVDITSRLSEDSEDSFPPVDARVPDPPNKPEPLQITETFSQKDGEQHVLSLFNYKSIYLKQHRK